MGKISMPGIVPKLVAPVAEVPLGSIAEGQIVKVNENGGPVEFYVAKHNYEPTLNGNGRTLLVRKECYDERQWHTSNRNAYASSSIDTWLDSYYITLFAPAIQDVIGTTKIYYTVSGGHHEASILARSIFLVSATELGFSGGSVNKEGDVLPIAPRLKIATLNGSPVLQMTRTPHADRTGSVYFAMSNGSLVWGNCTDAGGNRPSFTLPSTALFDDNMNFMGVS